ncbi:MAG TPA: hypothetical protein VH165_30400 [Kofleriaceae bacterium]|jgi:hypothetical protein|nr:hypothetical protein [Kofleriaceae bacterium]
MSKHEATPVVSRGTGAWSAMPPWRAFGGTSRYQLNDVVSGNPSMRGAAQGGAAQGAGAMPADGRGSMLAASGWAITSRSRGITPAESSTATRKLWRTSMIPANRKHRRNQARFDDGSNVA